MLKLKPFDTLFLGIVLLISIFGLLMVYESSVVYSSDVFGGKYHFLFLQFGWMSIGFVGMFFLSRIDLEIIKKYSPYAFILAILLLGVILFPSTFVPSVYGAKRWFVLNPSPFPLIPFIGRIGFQPSEFAKLASIVFFASFLSSKRIKEMGLWHSIIRFNLLMLSVCGFVFIEPDFTTAFILGFILIVMYFLSNVSLIYFFVAGPILALVATLYAISSEYRRERIQTLLNPESMDKMGAGYHIRQVMIALGSGGFLGLGLGHSRQKYAYLPEVTTDSIFAIIGEEFGFIGTVIVVAAFCALILRGLKIAQKAADPFSSLLAYGVITWIAVQALINLGAMTRMLPLTGVTLPLISYGGSSMIFMLWGLGLVINVSRGNID
ncbi:stage V sporulation protein E [candidate division WWE3 bacterium CG_4_9_14_0_2_um_filter_35_11]|uniref:Probable peptidoglycan glycosyltransferase FtsW n=1 Tax=candidate division WWE3 bacterium CG_4_9_14_0_2_um_filter_35_11 TaxID=1975077 RepID=A0A2M8EMD9_UNCKA|nr:MAG: stage V sporulation protein E [candidate division WWE3 bacterium CG10_big_fil_rev_8_21_14_0_10_35_32]PJC23889.1 MAG: stage V sporulation protein E [candidate division WWE3 bacterium CG_4_9_14_0_2_um_filter_35_11]